LTATRRDRAAPITAGRAKAREQAAAAQAAMARQAMLDRIEWQMTQLRAELETATRYADEGAAILAELASMKPFSFIP
jgi:hypothetical protein